MSYEVVLTDTAKQDLRGIALWIAEKSEDITIAKGFVMGLRAACRKLAELSNRGAFPKDRTLKSMGYRFIVCKNYLIFYLVDEANKTVNIMAILNIKTDYLSVMKKYI